MPFTVTTALDGNVRINLGLIEFSTPEGPQRLPLYAERSLLQRLMTSVTERFGFGFAAAAPSNVWGQVFTIDTHFLLTACLQPVPATRYLLNRSTLLQKKIAGFGPAGLLNDCSLACYSSWVRSIPPPFCLVYGKQPPRLGTGTGSAGFKADALHRYVWVRWQPPDNPRYRLHR
jgi:hypothetical protein